GAISGLWSSNSSCSSMQPRQDRLRCVHGVAERGLHFRVRRQVDIDARAEADEPVALSPLPPCPLVKIAENPPCDESCDLHAGDVLPAARLQPQSVPFVLQRGLVERGIEE